MNQAAIIHRPTSDYIYPSSRNTLELQLITARADADEVELWYWMRYETDPAKIRRQRLHVSLQDALHDYYRTTVCTGQIAAYTRYCFHLKAGTDELWLGANGLQDTEPHMNGNFFEFLWPNPTDGFSAPAWRSRQVYYQIFPERFKNGDPSRTPPSAEAWGSAPTRENFMGGDLAGIAQQLDYIQSLGATCLYLTPIFRAPSNHKYDTVDYFEIDPAFGTKDDLRRLVDGVHARGMRIILDGVFNHCGYWWDKFQDVVKNGKASPYCSWFFIHSYPVDAEQQNYDCVGHYKWMPKLNLADPDARDYFLSVGRYWLEEFGIDGWRLDVADELPMRFLRDLRTAVRTQDAQAALLGEVWEDASNKVSYGAQRCYCLGDTLDSVMNYPLREAAIGFVTGTLDAYAFCRRVESLRENYPLPFFYSLMNLMGSHDRARLLNVLAGEAWEGVDPLERGGCRLSDAQRALAIRRLAEMWKLYAALPGMPSVYYGDEAGMEGAADPFCRFPYPWGREDAQVMTITREALALRASRPILRRGALQLHPIDRDTVRIRRFAYAGCDVFGEPLDDAEFEINVHAIHA